MHAHELLGITNEREMARRLNSMVHSTLEEIASLPERVTDEHWMGKLGESESTPAKRSRRAA